MKERSEFAAGGIVGRGGKVLLVQVRNLEGRIVWTFPKGHLEKGETWLSAARREVEEETGWKCRSLGLLSNVAYRFMREGRPVFKRVRWYRMEPVEKTGKPDAEEIRRAKWIDAAKAAKALTYPSDLKIMKKFLAGAACLILLAAAARAAPAAAPPEELTRRITAWREQKDLDVDMNREFLAYSNSVLAPEDQLAMVKEMGRTWKIVLQVEFDTKKIVAERSAAIEGKVSAKSMDRATARLLREQAARALEARLFYIYGNFWRRSLAEWPKVGPKGVAEILGAKLNLAISDRELEAVNSSVTLDPAKYGLPVHPPANYGDAPAKTAARKDVPVLTWRKGEK